MQITSKLLWRLDLLLFCAQLCKTHKKKIRCEIKKIVGEKEQLSQNPKS